MIRKQVLLAMFLTFVASAFALCQAQVPGTGRFVVDVDHARFYGNDSLTYVEIYYSVGEDKLTYKRGEGRYLGGMNITATVYGKEDVVAQKDWTAPHVVTDTANLRTLQNIIGLATFALQTGDYECELRASDFQDPLRADTTRFPLKIRSFAGTEATLSDIELCSSFRQAEASDNVFYKNTFEVLPNVANVYGEAAPVLLYYMEVYNLNVLPGAVYGVRVIVEDSDGKEVITNERTKRRLNNTAVEVGRLKIQQLETGRYILSVFLTDSSKNVIASSSKKFFVYRAGADVRFVQRTGGSGVAASEFAVMGEPDLDEDFGPATYIASASEAEQFRGLASIKGGKERLVAKRNFLYDFWKRRDPDPANPANEFRRQYLNRIQYANNHYGSGYKKGWRTERGRVYIVYGESDEIERFPSSYDDLPYEIWHYNELQGGVFFVFVDRTGFGDWILVNSTHRNEIHDPTWQQYLKK